MVEGYVRGLPPPLDMAWCDNPLPLFAELVQHAIFPAAMRLGIESPFVKLLRHVSDSAERVSGRGYWMRE